MLIKLKAFSIAVAGDELNFRVSESLRGQECEHLVPQ